MPPGDDVGLDVVKPRGAFEAHAETGDHFVEDQQDAVALRDRAQELQVLFRLQQQTVVRRDGLDDHRRDVVRVIGDRHLEGAPVVQRHHDRIVRHRVGHAGGGGDAEGRQPAARLHQQGVHVSVVTAFELDDQRTTRHAAREPDGRHHRFRAGAHEPDHLDVPVVFQNELRQLVLLARRRAEGCPQAHRVHDRRAHARMVVPEDQRSPGTTEVDVTLSVGVPDMTSVTFFEKQRRAADRAERADG